MIVTRGLGLGGWGSLILAGAGMTLGIVVLPPAPLPEVPYTNWAPYKPSVKVVEQRSVTLRLSTPSMQALLGQIEAKGSAELVLLSQRAEAAPGRFDVAGAAHAAFLGVQSGSKLGKYVVSGQQNLSDEEIAAIIATMLGL